LSKNVDGLAPDGHGWRARLGVLTHDDSAISESELWTMAPEGVSLHTSRVFFGDPAAFGDPPGPETATDLLARLPLQAIIYAWTAGSYLLGTTGEKELLSRVEQHANGIPVLMSAPAATAAFRALEAERVALIHGPFFTDDFDHKGVAYFEEAGFRDRSCKPSHAVDCHSPSEYRPGGESSRDLRMGSEQGAIVCPGHIHRWERRPFHWRDRRVRRRSPPAGTHRKPGVPVVCATRCRYASRS